MTQQKSQYNFKRRWKSNKIESENKILLLEGEEYVLEMRLYNNNYIEIKIIQSSPMGSCCYI